MSRLSPSVLELTRTYAELWRKLPADLPDQVPCSLASEQEERQRRIDALLRDVEHAPNRQAARRMVMQFASEGREADTGSLPERADDLSVASRTFVRRARIFDRRMPEADMRQALRNFWTFNALQLLIAGRVRFQAGAFAYSLLYPYTDNLFDDPARSQACKEHFGEWISRRLAGDVPPPGVGRADAALAGKVHRLICLIEQEYSRREYPLVYEGLQAIHDAQRAALRRGDSAGAQERDRLTVGKGGTSVLADALLVRGRLTAPEVTFAFRLGVLLQLIDDLQDARADGREGAPTLFSTGRPRAMLREEVYRLLRFLYGTFSPVPLAGTDDVRRCIGMMRRACVALVCEAVCVQARRFGKAFVEEIAPLCHVHPRYLASLRTRAPSLRRLVLLPLPLTMEEL